MATQTTPLCQKKSHIRVENYDFRKKDASNPPQPVIAKEKKKKKILITPEYKEQIERERALIESLTISKDTLEIINTNVENSFIEPQYTAHIYAFAIIEGVVKNIDSTTRYESRLISMEAPRDLSRNQLCLDIEKYPECHRMIASIILHLENNKPTPLHYVISRQRITQRCKPSIYAESLWGQYFNHEASGYYYKIRVDWTQTKPMNTINDY